MGKVAQPKSPFADEEDCCERCSAACHTTEDHDSESLKDPFADPSACIQRIDSGLEIKNTSIKANERLILTRFATNQATDADCAYILKTLHHCAYQAGYAKFKRHSCKRDYTAGYCDGLNSARIDNQRDEIDQAFKLGRDYGFSGGAYKRFRLRPEHTSFEQSREDEELDEVMKREGFVKKAGGGWVMVGTSLQEDLKEDWIRFKGLFKSRKPKAVRGANGEGKWKKLTNFDDKDGAGPKLRERFGVPFRMVKARNDVSRNF